MTMPTTFRTPITATQEDVVRRPGGAAPDDRPRPRSVITALTTSLLRGTSSATSRAKSSPALGVAAVPVERRARGREQHDVAGAGEPRRGASPRRASIRPARPRGRRVRTRARPRPRPSPIATTARTRSAAPARTDRSRSLLRPPATSTTGSSNAWSAREGRVRVRGLRVVEVPHATSSPTSATRWGSLRKFSSARAIPARVAPTSTAAAAAASAFARSWRSNARFGSRRERPRRQDRRSRRRARAPSRGTRRSRTRRGVRARPPRAACDLGIVGVGDEQVVGALVGEDARLGVAVALERAVPVEVVVGKVQQERRPWGGSGST